MSNLPLPTSSSSHLQARGRSGTRRPLVINAWPALRSPSRGAVRRWTVHAMTSYHLNARLVWRVARTALLAFLIAAALFLFIWEPHIEIAAYRRAWIQKQIMPTGKLAGCFEEGNVSPFYNLSEGLYGARHTEVQAGFSMQLGLDCFDFAGAVQVPPALAQRERRTNIFHTYWRTDLAPFGPRQEWMLKSFLATQPHTHSKLILWSNGDLAGKNPLVKRYIDRWPDVFEARVADVKALARGTVIEGSEYLELKDEKAWLDGDIIRLLVIWHEGGTWVDMDMLWTRDFYPLLEHEFVTQWDCYDKPYSAFNGAVMHFHKHSPYLCEALSLICTSDAPRTASTDWGSVLYLRLWRRLAASGIPPFKILPHCFTDGRACRLDNRLPDPFEADPRGGGWTGGIGREEGGGLDVRLGKVFAVHLHNQWAKAFPKGGWVERLLLKRYEETLERLGLKL